MGILRLKHKHPKGFSIESCKSDDDIRVLFLSFSLDNLVDVKPTKEAVPINPVTSSMMRLFSICTASVFPTKGEKVGPHVYIPLYPSIISVGTHVSTQASQNSNRMIPVVSLQAKAKYISQVDGKMIGGGTSGVIAFNPRHLIASLPNNNRIFTTSSSSSALLNLLHEYSPDQYPIHSSSTPDVLQLSDKTCKTFKSSNILSPLTASIFSFFENPSRKETTSITELTYGYKANMFMIRFDLFFW